MGKENLEWRVSRAGHGRVGNIKTGRPVKPHKGRWNGEVSEEGGRVWCGIKVASWAFVAPEFRIRGCHFQLSVHPFPALAVLREWQLLLQESLHLFPECVWGKGHAGEADNCGEKRYGKGASALPFICAHAGCLWKWVSTLCYFYVHYFSVSPAQCPESWTSP